MNVSTFYALFSATCFTLVGLWWGVVQRDTTWVLDRTLRRSIGGVYLAFLLPGLMGLFAQVGGVEEPLVWRLSFVLIAVIGVVAMWRLLGSDDDPGVWPVRVGAVSTYILIAVVGMFPQLASVIGLRGIQVEGILLVLLVALGHAMVWRFLVHTALSAASELRTTPHVGGRHPPP